MDILTIIIWAVVLFGATLFFAKFVAPAFGRYAVAAIAIFAFIMLLLFLQVTGLFDFRSLRVLNDLPRRWLA